jgi:hypothetical protein
MVYAQAMRLGEDEKAALQALVEGTPADIRESAPKASYGVASRPSCRR